jgi:isoquinoline 1-oxidoreductase alpha subunit
MRLLPGRPDHDAAALLKSNPTPTNEDIDGAMAGNLCRCATYMRIRSGIHRAAEIAASASTKPKAPGLVTTKGGEQ